MIDGALMCWIIAAVMLPGALLILLLISLLLSPKCQSSEDAIQVNLDRLIRISKAHGVFFDPERSSATDVDRIKKSYEELVEVARKEDAGSPLVLAG